MRLSNEQLKHIKKWFADCEEKDYIPENGLTIGGLLDTIEFLQQENEQLKAQAAVMREALKNIYYGPYTMSKGYMKMLEEALATDAGKDYHNPTDLEALAKAKQALLRVQWISNYNNMPGKHCECCSGEPERGHSDYCIINKAIDAIEKTIGGQER